MNDFLFILKWYFFGRLKVGRKPRKIKAWIYITSSWRPVKPKPKKYLATIITIINIVMTGIINDMNFPKEFIIFSIYIIE